MGKYWDHLSAVLLQNNKKESCDTLKTNKKRFRSLSESPARLFFGRGGKEDLEPLADKRY